MPTVDMTQTLTTIAPYLPQKQNPGVSFRTIFFMILFYNVFKNIYLDSFIRTFFSYAPATERTVFTFSLWTAVLFCYCIYCSIKTVDSKNGIIIDVAATAGNVPDSQPYIKRIDYIERTVFTFSLWTAVLFCYCIYCSIKPVQRKCFFSRTDEEGMHYLSHETVDSKNGIIIDVAATAGNVPDSQP